MSKPGQRDSPMMGLVDFHCHLDLYPDLLAAVQECERRQIYTLAVTTTPKAWPRNHQVASHTKHVRAALGLHPQLIAERANEIDLWEEYLPQTRYVGEVGLDAGPRHYRSLDLQTAIFRRILTACAIAGNKVLTVHSVRAASRVLDLIDECLPLDRGRVVLHWFTGSRREAERAVGLGCYFSINAGMLQKESARQVVEMLPGERLLTETDGPFVMSQDRSAEPRDVEAVVNGVAHLRGVRPQSLCLSVLQNLRTLCTEL